MPKNSFAAAGHGCVPSLVCAAMIAACGGDDARKPAANNDAGITSTPDAAAPVSPSWTMCGYDLANSQLNPGPSKVKKDSVAQLKEAFRVVVGGGATSTPIVAGDTV